MMTARSALAGPAPVATVRSRLDKPLNIRWLGRVRYQDALAVQHSLFSHGDRNHLLLLEHNHVFTLGARADTANIIGDPKSMGAEVVVADRGGDVTYHGPGQLVGYPILTVPGKRGGGMADTAQYVHAVEQLLIDALDALGLSGCGRLADFPGVWIDPESARPRKIAAIGVRLSRGRSMHGFALNVDPDMTFFDAIVPCGITDKDVTSLRALGLDVSMKDVTDVVARLADQRWGTDQGGSRADVAWRQRPEDLAAFSLGRGPGSIPVVGQAVGLSITERKPEWMRVKADMGPDYRRLKGVMRDLDLVTVCEEAGCPNIFDCWNDGTATFMVLGDRCTRKCGFCLVDTRKPGPVDLDEPARVGEAVEKMGLQYAVVTMVARDDLPDGGAQVVADTIAAIRDRKPGTKVEVLISDLKGDPDALQLVFDAQPDVLNHNVETVPRLQRVVRPSAGYARSLAVLSRAKQAGMVTKTSIILGMGETRDEVVQTLTDLGSIGVDIVTLGQYLRPTTNHLPIDRWWHPDEFTELKLAGEAVGISHVEASPLTRSSYHAKQAQTAAADD
jgi:lipoic acid synthetase